MTKDKQIEESNIVINELLKSCLWIFNGYESGGINGLFGDEIEQLRKSIELANKFKEKIK